MEPESGGAAVMQDYTPYPLSSFAPHQHGSSALRHLALERGADLVLGLGPEFDRYKLPGARTQAAADIVVGDHEILASLVDAADQKVDVWIVCVPMVDGDPIESGLKIGFHLPREVSREGS